MLGSPVWVTVDPFAKLNCLIKLLFCVSLYDINNSFSNKLEEGAVWDSNPSSSM